jgi:hypothetical protein
MRGNPRRDVCLFQESGSAIFSKASPGGWQAMERDGVLVTFDSGVKELAAGELRDHLWLLKSR